MFRASIDAADTALSAPLRPLAAFSGTLSQRVYGTLKEAILELTLQPGAIVRKGEVCEVLGVSRSPVSEAVARLASEALLDVVPQAGTFVAKLSVDEVREGAFLREALELAAVEQVAREAAEEALVLLRRNLRLQQELVIDGDAKAFHAADAQFHETVLGLTGYRRLPVLSRTAWVHVDRARRLLLPEPGRTGETLEEHRLVLAAIEARDPEGARAALRTHLRQVVVRLERFAKERPELFS